MKIQCPYGEEEGKKQHETPVSDCVLLNAEHYGGKYSTIRCTVCGGMIAVETRRRVSLSIIGKSAAKESSWFE